MTDDLTVGQLRSLLAEYADECSVAVAIENKCLQLSSESVVIRRLKPLPMKAIRMIDMRPVDRTPPDTAIISLQVVMGKAMAKEVDRFFSVLLGDHVDATS